MIDYTDVIGRIHDKPAVEGKPSSNNGFLYTAVAKKLGLPVRVDDTAATICAIDRRRHPKYLDIQAPPISRDEVLGLAILGYTDHRVLNTWNFSPYKLPKFNLFKLLRQANDNVESYFPFKLKHRNHFWQNGHDQLYRFAFMVPFSDRHAILKANFKYSYFWHLVHIVTNFSQPEHRSSRLVRFVKTGKDIQAVPNYFGPAHPLSEHVNAKK